MLVDYFRNGENMSEENQVEQPAMDQPTVNPVQLTIQDLQLLSQVVDLASRRGAFHAAELAGVGTTYNKLAAFLVQVEAEEKAKQEAANQSQGE